MRAAEGGFSNCDRSSASNHRQHQPQAHRKGLGSAHANVCALTLSYRRHRNTRQRGTNGFEGSMKRTKQEYGVLAKSVTFEKQSKMLATL